MEDQKSVKKKKRAGTCFVPGCNTGYRSCKSKVSTFKAPKDKLLLEEWRKNIPRADKTLDDMSIVCENHFEPYLIEKFYRTIVDGKEVLTPRGRPILIKNAVPTRFPNLPHYLTKKLPKKRSQRSYCDLSTPTKKMKFGDVEFDSALEYLPSVSEQVRNIILPSDYWVCLKYRNNSNIVSFLTLDSFMEHGDIPDKKIVVKCITCSDFVVSVFIKDILFFPEKSYSSISELETLIKTVDDLVICKGVGNINKFEHLLDSSVNNPKYYHDGTILRYKNCLSVVNIGHKRCKECNKKRKSLMTQIMQRNSKSVRQCLKKKAPVSRIKILQQKATRLKNKSIVLMNKLNTKMNENSNPLPLNFRKFSHKQKLAIDTCIKAASRKSLKGFKFDNEWLLECVIMRMKSPKLYEHMRVNKILVLPGKTCLRNLVNKYKSGYGFNPKTFSVLKTKLQELDLFQKHGVILFDEIKLSESLQVKASGRIEGFVDYGTFTSTDNLKKLCNHGLVLLFQPFVGDWCQILGVFATKENMQGNVLSKILIEAILLAENAGLFVDAVVGDGATWNRSMWQKEFELGVTKSGEVKYKVQHPADDKRFLHFISDFPHLIKCLRNSFLNHGFKTPYGEVRPEIIKAAWKADQRLIRLKAMPRITRAHISPNNFEKMKVNLAFQLFSQDTLKGMQVYKTEISKQYGDILPTALFIEKISKLIDVMTGRTYSQGLFPSSSNENILKDFLKFLDLWEAHASDTDFGFLSKSTCLGLRVTIHSTLSILEYLTKKVHYSYLLTSRLSQDKIESFFGIVRQCKGCNDHPNSSEFLGIIQMLSFYNLAHPPKGVNVEPAVIESLVGLQPDKTNSAFSDIDLCIDVGDISDANKCLQMLCTNSDHQSMVFEQSDERLVYYTAGYVVRSFLVKTKCELCRCCLEEESEAVCNAAASFTLSFDMGGLIYPSNRLFSLICLLEAKFTACFSLNELHHDSILDIVSSLNGTSLISVGCPEHATILTKDVVKYYIITRLHFYVKQLNKNRQSKRNKLKFLKMRRVN